MCILIHNIVNGKTSSCTRFGGFRRLSRVIPREERLFRDPLVRYLVAVHVTKDRLILI